MQITAEELFAQRRKRFDDVIQLKTPDRIPIAPMDQGFFVKYAGLTWDEVMYDFEKAIAASRQTIESRQTHRVRILFLLSKTLYQRCHTAHRN